MGASEQASTRANAVAALMLLFAPRFPIPLASALETWRPTSTHIDIFLRKLVLDIEATWPGLYDALLDSWAKASRAGTSDVYHAVVGELLAKRLSLVPSEREYARARARELSKELFSLLLPVLDHPAMLGLELGDDQLDKGQQIRAHRGQEEDPGNLLQKQLLARVGRGQSSTRFLEWAGHSLEREKRQSEPDADFALDGTIALPDALKKAHRQAGIDATLGTIWDKALADAKRASTRQRKAFEKAISYEKVIAFTEEYEQPQAPTTKRDRERIRLALRDDSTPEANRIESEERRKNRRVAERELKRCLRALKKRLSTQGHRSDRVQTFLRIARYELRHPEALQREIADAISISVRTVKCFRSARRAEGW